MPTLGLPELILILIVVILLFGVGKVPKVARGLGEVMRELRRSRKEEEQYAPPDQLSPTPPTEGWLSRQERALAEIMDSMGEGLTLAATLQTLLEIFNVSEYRLAEETGVDRSTISRLVRGETKKPQKETLLKILTFFPALNPRWREELLTLAGHPPTEALPPLEHPPQVYLSCHGGDLSTERRVVYATLNTPRPLFAVEVGDETWSVEEVAASVRQSDYLVMVQGRLWVDLRRIEHQTVQENEQVTGLYFCKQGLPLQSEAEQFLEEVGQGQWKQFADADVLARQLWAELWDTMAREARAGRGRVSLQNVAVIYLATKWLAGKETTLPTLLQRLAAKADTEIAKKAPEQTPHVSPSDEPEPEPAPTEKETTEQKPSSRVRRRVLPWEPELIRIPAGRFWMGTDRLAQELAGIRWQDGMEHETPPHQLYLPDYAIARYPITNAQYKRFVDAEGHRPPSHWTDGVIPAGKEDHPVVNVTWRDAVAYCKWLKRVTGTPYQLPSEAEWEKAARGTNGQIYPWGNKLPTPRLCNFDGNVNDTTSVDQYSPQGDSPYGCADMAGNVWEWTRSLYKEYPYDPGDGRENPETSGFRVLRGGSFLSSRRGVRCAFRYHWDPFYRNWYGGFRIVLASPLPRDSGRSEL